VRHGQAFTNLASPPRDKTPEELDALTPDGEAAVRELVASLPKQVAMVLASPKGRTRQTAHILAGDEGVTQESALRPLGGESLKEGGERVGRLVQRLRAKVAPATHAVLVTHSDTGALLLGELHGTPLGERMRHHKLATGEMVCVELRGGAQTAARPDASPPPSSAVDLGLPEGVSCGGVAQEVRTDFSVFTQRSFEAALANAGLERTHLAPESATYGKVAPPPRGKARKARPGSTLWTFSTTSDRGGYPEFVRDASGAVYVLERAPRYLDTRIDAQCRCPPPPPGAEPESMSATFRIDGHKKIEYDAKLIDTRYYHAPDACPPPA
jgi:broad specificity phosphatase PhoE